MRSTLSKNLHEMEAAAEETWNRPRLTLQRKLRWRARHVRHSFHVLPGEKILEIGAGSGFWTEHLTRAFKSELQITAACADPLLSAQLQSKNLPNVEVVNLAELIADYPDQSFDYVVGLGSLAHNLLPETLHAVYRLLKPSGQFLFFEGNQWYLTRCVNNVFASVARMLGRSSYKLGVEKFQILKTASRLGFTHIEVTPYDIVPSCLPERFVRLLQSKLYIFEHAPFVRELCSSNVVWGRRPGQEEDRRPKVNLATRPELRNAVSVVVPCYNESMNIEPFVKAILNLYNDYIYEIVIVNDNSTDTTAEVTANLALSEPRLKLVNRKPPNGVGRALKDGYAAASGKYILSMDSDFVLILSELRDLFDAVADGHDGAIGSRFSHDSVLMNYPFSKIIGNRAAHFLIRIFLTKVRDISNNLKLYRADIFKNLDLKQPHFAANLETGLKPILAGYDIKEVPISWIDRSISMGTSSFKVFKVGPAYFSSLLTIIWESWVSKGNQEIKASIAAKNISNPAALLEIAKGFIDPIIPAKGQPIELMLIAKYLIIITLMAAVFFELIA